MGFPRCRKYFTDQVYDWTFNILVPLSPLDAKYQCVHLEDLKTHPSGEVIGVCSIGVRVESDPSPYNVFTLDLNVSVSEMEHLRSFFVDGGFWFYPDQEIDEGFLVSYFPSEFRPIPLPNGRFIIQGELAQIGRQDAPNVDTSGDPSVTMLQVPPMPIHQQSRANAALSTINNAQYFTFPRPESSTSDWSLLDAHVIRHEIRYTDRYDRVLFNWVKSVKRVYYLVFESVTREFVDFLLGCVARRKTRFYPNVGANIDATMPIDINPDHRYIDVRVVEQSLDIINHQSNYSTAITLEEL